MFSKILNNTIFIIAIFLIYPSYSFATDQENKKTCVKEGSKDNYCFPNPFLLPKNSLDKNYLPLRGTYTFRTLGLKIYTIGVYAPKHVTYHTLLKAKNPRAIIIRYHRGIDKDDSIKVSENYINKNPNNNKQNFKEALEILYSNIVDINAKDTLSISYQPNSGMTIHLNSKLQNKYKGEELAKAYMGIWLSSYAVDSDAIYEIFKTNK